MDALVTPALLAVLFGGVVIVLLFVPFVAISFRRHGGLTLGRFLTWASAPIYAFALLTYTLLPFPDGDDIRCRTPILDPLAAARDVVRDAAGGSSLLHNAALQQLVFNVALFVPLGFLLRVLLRRGVVAATVAGLLTSLLIELTQLTGVWGLYACAYRFFDIADLITNTLGAVVGSMLALTVSSRRRAQPDRSLPRSVTASRRLLGMLVDLLSVILISGTIVAVAVLGAALLGGPLDPAWRSIVETVAAWAPLIVQGGSVLSTGSTMGERAVLLRGVSRRANIAMSRTVRLIAGIGGYIVLIAAGQGGWALLLAIVSTVSVVCMPSRRGLAQVIAGMDVEDVRTGPTARPAGHATPTGDAAFTRLRS